MRHETGQVQVDGARHRAEWWLPCGLGTATGEAVQGWLSLGAKAGPSSVEATMLDIAPEDTGKSELAAWYCPEHSTMYGTLAELVPIGASNMQYPLHLVAFKPPCRLRPSRHRAWPNSG